ncbi:unnamed protein product, partial [marine sediment metagenome]
VLYSTVARTNVPVRLSGKVSIETGAVAGEWDNAPTELTVWSSSMKKTGDGVQSVITEDNAFSSSSSTINLSPSLKRLGIKEVNNDIITPFSKA